MSDWQRPSGNGWCTYQLINMNGKEESGRFVLRQCPRCSAMVQPGNEDHHEAWHAELAAAITEGSTG